MASIIITPNPYTLTDYILAGGMVLIGVGLAYLHTREPNPPPQKKPSLAPSNDFIGLSLGYVGSAVAFLLYKGAYL